MGPRSTLARLLFPSWAFFDVPDAPPQLEIRQDSRGAVGGSWQSAFSAPTRRWWHLLFNPMGTQVLWYQTQIERFCANVANGFENGTDNSSVHDVERQVAALIVRKIAERCIPRQWPRDESPSWRYRIVMASHPTDSGPPTVVFESDLLA